MLKSRHIFIEQGMLIPNDNGKKKFNKSEIRYEDEELMKWISYINDRLVEAAKETKDLILIAGAKDLELLYQYTQLEHVDFQRKIVADDRGAILHAMEKEKKGNYVIAACEDEVEDRERFDGRLYFLYEIRLEEVFRIGDLVPFLPEVRDLLRKRNLIKLKNINEELEKISADEKVIIYGAGYQTEAFLRYANISRLNLIGVVDRKCAAVFDYDVKGTSRGNLCEADVILVMPYFAANEIKRYLDSLCLNNRIFCLADICGDVIFTGNENVWAPDLDDTWMAAFDEKQIIEVTKEINRQSPYFASVKKNRPYSSHLYPDKDLSEFAQSIALVMQGPIVYKQDFTFRTIQLYHNYFPQIRLILSVWEEEKEIQEWKKLSDYNAEVIYVKRPKIRGYQNVNLQLATSYQGMKRAKEYGCQYVFKTRTDMRFYSPDMVALMYFYIKKFPLMKKEIQKERLMIFPPRYDYFYFIPDFFMFGQVDDMLNYWDINRGFTDQYIGESAETMLGIRYAEWIGKRVKNNLLNLKEYDQVIKDYFGVVEDKMLDYIWYKYFYHKPWESEYHCNVMNFVDWLAGQEVIV